MTWNTSETIKPNNVQYSQKEIRELIIITRLSLYNRAIPCGAKAIRRELENFDVKPLPSLTRINRTLTQFGLTHRRTGFY